MLNIHKYILPWHYKVTRVHVTGNKVVTFKRFMQMNNLFD